MSVLAQTLLTLVRSHLVTLVLLTVWHIYLNFNDYFFTEATKTLAGLKAGMSCAGMVIVVFLVMFLAAFSALCLMMKLPNPRRYTGCPFARESLMLSMLASSTV